MATAQIQVNSTNPNTASQGTTNLNITVAGNGFKKGAKAQWFITGTTDPGFPRRSPMQACMVGPPDSAWGRVFS
jgi:hypothetical protein